MSLANLHSGGFVGYSSVNFLGTGRDGGSRLGDRFRANVVHNFGCGGPEMFTCADGIARFQRVYHFFPV